MAGYGIISTINVCTIFVVSGLTLKTEDIKQSIKHPRGLILGLASILGLTTLMGFVVQELPFSQSEFADGLTIFCVVPTTLSSGVALVQAVRCRFSLCCSGGLIDNSETWRHHHAAPQLACVLVHVLPWGSRPIHLFCGDLHCACAPFLCYALDRAQMWGIVIMASTCSDRYVQARGNAALALMLTVVTNLVGIFTVPFILKGMLGGSSVSLDAVTLLVKLLITILAPLSIGKAVREIVPKVPAFVTRHKTALSLLSNGSLIMIVWMTISDAQVCTATPHHQDSDCPCGQNLFDCCVCVAR